MGTFNKRAGKALKSSGAVIGMAVAVSLFFGLTTHSKAASLFYNMTLTAYDGPLAGTVGSGSFSIDSTLLNGVGIEEFTPDTGGGLLSFGGSFNGTAFTIDDDPVVTFFLGVPDDYAYIGGLGFLNFRGDYFFYSPSGSIGQGATDLTTGFVETTAVSAVPLPAALPLFISGLFCIGLIARQRKRSTAK